MRADVISGDGGRVTTFLMGDLVGSTSNWLAAPAQMEEALRFHDGVVAHAVAAAGGDLFKHTGDGFLAQFDDPDAAVDTARAIRAGLGRVNAELRSFVRARLAIDTGWATARGGDWFGPTVNRVARITDLVSAEGLVITNASSEMMRRTRGGRDLGEVVLRSHDVATRLLGLDDATLAAGAAGVGVGGARMPRPRSSFVGRVAEIDRLQALLSDHRLVTVVATGGAGKTRIAIEVATRYSAAGFVDLVPSQDAGEVARQVAEGAGVDMDGLSSSATPEAIRSHTVICIGERELLLVLDNCEHVLESARAEIDELLGRCPGVRVLATSRERLGARGEQVWQLPSMDVGAELFFRRAEAHGVELGDSEEVAEAVAHICAHLDGLPLAIELAAARLTDVALGDLQRDLDTLMIGQESADGDGSNRHRTMRDVVAWSYRTLDEATRTLFERVALLEGSFRRFDVALLGDIDSAALPVLVRRSLLVQERDGLELHFRMLEPVRQVARALLDEGGNTDAAMTDLLAGLRSEFATEYGVGYWDWATLDHLRPLLPTIWRITEWLAGRGQDRELLAFTAGFAGVANVFAGADRVIKIMSSRIDLLKEFTPEQQAEMLVSYSLAGIAAMQIEHTTAGVVAIFGLELDDCPPQVFAYRSAALGAMNDAYQNGVDSPFAFEMLDLARTMAAKTGNAYERAAVEAFDGWALLLAGRWSDAIAASKAGLEQVAAENYWHVILSTNLGLALIRLGRSDEALALARAHPDLGRFTYMADPLGYVEILALADTGADTEVDRVLASSIERVLGSIHPGHRSDLVLVAVWVAIFQNRIEDARQLLAFPVSTRGPHALQLTRGLEEAAGLTVARTAVEGADATEARLTPLLEAELARIRATSAIAGSGS